MTPEDLALALLRTTLVTSAAACVAGALLTWLKVDSPRTHRVTWLLVVAQGWLLIPWTLEIETPPPPRVPVQVVEVPQVFVPMETADITFVDAPPPEQPPAPFPVAAVATYAWLLGAAALALVAAVRYATIVRTLPRGEAPDDPQWQHEWTRALRRAFPPSAPGSAGGFPAQHKTSRPRTPGQSPRLKPRRRTYSRIDFRLTAALGPLVAFIPWHYLLLAPRPLWTALTSPERSAILRHELAHIRRRDLWKSLAFRVLALPQWFNPLVWLAARRFDEAAEWSCDREAAGRRRAAARGLARNQTTLASSLLRTAELASLKRPPRTLGFLSAIPTPNRRTALARRIQRLVTPRLKEESLMKRLALPALLALVAAAQLIRIEHVAAEPAPTTSLPAANAIPSPSAVRKDYKETVWPRYVIEPPDILLVEGVKLVPKSPHRIETFDVLLIRVVGALQDQPIDDQYNVDADGSVNLGPTYGRIKVVNLTIEEAEEEIREQLARILTEAEVSVSLLASAGAQQITGQHLVAMDGRVNLGAYGSVFVAGMTIEQAKEAIEQKLAEVLDQPRVSVDVLAYNSKVYYVITKGAGLGDDIVRAPITGNETVLDAVANLGGISQVSSTKMWIARPAPNGVGVEQILHVSWKEIASGGSTATNYQLLPGDRLFIDEPDHQTPPTANGNGAPLTAPATKPVAVLSLHWKDNDASEPSLETIVELAPQETIATFLKRIELPKATRNPPDIDLAEAQITLGRDVKDGLGKSHRSGHLILWDESTDMPRGDNENVELQHGDVVTVDLRKPPVPPLPQPAAAPVPIAPPPVAPTTATATRVGDLRPGDVLTVLVDYGTRKSSERAAAGEHRERMNFQIACEIAEILPNGNLSIRGNETIRASHEQRQISLSGEVRPDVVSPNRTVSSTSIVNLNIDIEKRPLVPNVIEHPIVSPADVRDADPSYKLQPGDAVEVAKRLDRPDVRGESRYAQRSLIEENGDVALSPEKTVKLAGQTLDEARQHIQEACQDDPAPGTFEVRLVARRDEVVTLLVTGAVQFHTIQSAVCRVSEALRSLPPNLEFASITIVRKPAEKSAEAARIPVTWVPALSTVAPADYQLQRGDRLEVEVARIIGAPTGEVQLLLPVVPEPAPGISAWSYPTPYPAAPVAPTPLPQPAPYQPVTQVAVPRESLVSIEYSWTGTSSPRHSSFLFAEGLTVSRVMTLLVRRENRLHDSMLEQVIGVPEVFSGANILVRRPVDSRLGYRHAVGEEKWTAHWDDAASRIISGDDVELKPGDKMFVTLLDVKVSSQPIPDGDPWVEIHVADNGGTIQRVRFKHGLTIAEAVAAMSPPPAIDFAKATVTHCRPQPGLGDLALGKFLTIKWEAEHAPNKNFEVQSQDFIRIDPTGRPFVRPLPVAGLQPAPAVAGAYSPYAPAIPGVPGVPASAPQYAYPSPYRAAPAPMPAIPDGPAPPIPTGEPPAVAPAGVAAPRVANPAQPPIVHYLITWNGDHGRKKTWDSTSELQKSDTVGSFVARLLQQVPQRALDLGAIDLSTATVYLKREGAGPNSSKSWVVPWDKATGIPAKGEDRPLESHDLLIIGLNGVEPAKTDDVSIELKLNGGRDSRQRVPFKLGLTVADLIAATVLPNPMDFAKARMSLFKPDVGSTHSSRGTVLPIAWESGRPTKDTNYAVTAGAMLTIDFNELPPQPPLPSGTTVESANAYPQSGPTPVGSLPVFAFMQFVGSDQKMRNTCIHNQPLVDGQTVADLLRTLKLPQPVDFAKVQLTLSTPDAANPNRRVRRPIEWDHAAGQPTAETNIALQAGAVLFIDAMAPPLKADSLIPPTAGYAPQPQPQPWVPVVESPIFSPQPAPMPAPVAAPGPPAAVADGIAYKFSLLEDTSGDLVEFIGHDEPNPGAIHQTAALEPALRVLKKHGLVKTIGDPTIRTQAGRPAAFELGVPAVGKEKEFIAQHVKIVGREALPLTATGPQPEGRPINVEIEAHADHAGERCTLDAAIQLAPGQSAIARFKTKDGGASPLYLVVTPEWVEE